MKSPRKEVLGAEGSYFCELKYFSPHIRTVSFLTFCLPAAVAMTMEEGCSVCVPFSNIV